MSYIVSLVEATRTAENVVLGVSPRGTLSLLRVSKGYAALDNRDYVTPDDVKKAAMPVLSHRMMLSSSAKIKKDADRAIIEDLLERVPVPTEAVLGWSAR